jgi:hypothetical protein
MPCVDVRRAYLTVADPTSVWHGRVGQIDSGPHPDPAGIWWRDHLTGTRVRFPLPTP